METLGATDTASKSASSPNFSRLGMSRPDAARYLSMSVRTFDQFVSDNEIPCVQVKGRQRFERIDLDAAVERQKMKSIEREKSGKCRSGSPRVRPTINTNTKFPVLDFEAQRRKRTKGAQK